MMHIQGEAKTTNTKLIAITVTRNRCCFIFCTFD